jgi:hypothetical protein
VDVGRPHLAASPDGVVIGEDAVIEVKCPFNGKEQKLHPARISLSWKSVMEASI